MLSATDVLVVLYDDVFRVCVSCVCLCFVCVDLFSVRFVAVFFAMCCVFGLCVNMYLSVVC